MTRRIRSSSFLSSAGPALAMLSLLATPASGADREPPRSAGFVDGSAFASLAGDDADIVEVNLQAPLLRALSRIDAEEEGFGEFVRNLQSISAYIVGLDGNTARTERATRMVHEMETKLERQGWQRLAVVREKGTRLNVYVRNSEETIDGLVVLAVDSDESKVVFANIAGTIDLARLGQLSQTFSVPGLDSLKDMDAHGKQRKTAPKHSQERKKERKVRDRDTDEDGEEEEPEP